MTPAEFREYGKKVVDQIADYQEAIESYPVLSTISPGDIRKNLPEQAPEKGEPFETILSDWQEKILPGITHWQSPNFFAYFSANASGPAILGDLVSSGLGVQGMLWATSPACTELEAHMMDWLIDLLDLPTHFRSDTEGGGVIQDTASSGTLCALLAARERATRFRSNEEGLKSHLVAYTSSQAHSSVEKAVKIAGLGRTNLRIIGVDKEFAMNPDTLENEIRKDREEGRIPTFVCATVGTTSSTAIDPVHTIGEICRQHGIWLHVDAAMAGPAAACPEFRHIHDGIELADSYAFNPHKWMLTNFDCSAFFVRDREVLIRTLTILPEYLRNRATDSGEVTDYRDWQIQLGRRFRALKLWFVLRYYGKEGIRRHIRNCIELAGRFRSWVGEDPEYELLAPTPLNTVCFRHRKGDLFNEELMNRLNAEGKIYLTHTRLDGKFSLRLAVGQPQTEEKHVKGAWDRIRETALSAGSRQKNGSGSAGKRVFTSG